MGRKGNTSVKYSGPSMISRTLMMMMMMVVMKCTNKYWLSSNCPHYSNVSSHCPCTSVGKYLIIIYSSEYMIIRSFGAIGTLGLYAPIPKGSYVPIQ